LKTGLPIALLTNRPDVRIAENNLAIAYYGVKAARAAQYPSINLSGSAGWTNNIGGTIVNPTGAILGAAGSLFLPLFNAGALRGATRIEKSKMEQARLDFQQTILNAGAEVNNAISLYQIAVAKEQYRKNEIASLKVALESTELLKQHSSTTYLEVLTAEQSLLSAETNASADRLEKVTAIINLYHALGGGTK
jgi:outer membrane protein TolC